MSKDYAQNVRARRPGRLEAQPAIEAIAVTVSDETRFRPAGWPLWLRLEGAPRTCAGAPERTAAASALTAPLMRPRPRGRHRSHPMHPEPPDEHDRRPRHVQPGIRRPTCSECLAADPHTEGGKPRSRSSASISSRVIGASLCVMSAKTCFGATQAIRARRRSVARPADGASGADCWSLMASAPVSLAAYADAGAIEDQQSAPAAAHLDAARRCAEGAKVAPMVR